MAKDVDDLRNAQVALTPHTITLDKKSKSNLTLEVYPELKRRGDIFIFWKSNFDYISSFLHLYYYLLQNGIYIKVTRSQSALKACENIMIKKMDAEKVADILYGKGTIVNSSTIQEIKVYSWIQLCFKIFKLLNYRCFYYLIYSLSKYIIFSLMILYYVAKKITWRQSNGVVRKVEILWRVSVPGFG